MIFPGFPWVYGDSGRDTERRDDVGAWLASRVRRYFFLCVDVHTKQAKPRSPLRGSLGKPEFASGEQNTIFFPKKNYSLRIRRDAPRTPAKTAAMPTGDLAGSVATGAGTA